MNDITDEMDFEQYLKDTEVKSTVKNSTVFAGMAKDYFRDRNKKGSIFLPWPKVNEHFDIRSGEVTLWAGQGGHGKSTITSQVALSLIGQGEKVCMASFEMPPLKTWKQMLRMYSRINLDDPSFNSEAGLKEIDECIDEFSGWSSKNLYICSKQNMVTPRYACGMVQYVARELGVRHIFIDSLMKCVIDEEKMAEVKAFVDSLCSIAKEEGVHIHLLCHLRKPSKESDIPDKNDVKGTGAIVDQVDNIFMVWRNKPKEEAAKEGKRGKELEPDMRILCRKQRHYVGMYDGEPYINLWREHDSGQFVAQAGDEAQYFVNYPHFETRY